MGEATDEVVEIDGVDLWTRRAGGPDRPAVLLLAGASMASPIWQLGMEQALEDAGLAVVSFDWRDTGRSTWRRFRDHPYSFDRLVADARAVALAWGLERWGVLGYSMGGCVAQFLAVQHPELVGAVGLVSSGFASKITTRTTARNRELFAVLAAQASDTDDQLVASLIDQWRAFHGRAADFDEEEWRRRITGWVRWGYNPRCPHIKLGPEVFSVDRTEALRSLAAPTLIVHGDDDPMFPHEHAEALRRAIPDSNLVTMPGHGHELFADPTAISVLVEHFVTTLAPAP